MTERVNPYLDLWEKWLTRLGDENRSRVKAYIVDRRKLEIIHQHVIVKHGAESHGSTIHHMSFDLEDVKTGKPIRQVSKSNAFPVKGGAEYRLYELIRKDARKLLDKLHELEEKMERINLDKLLNASQKDARQETAMEIARLQDQWLRESYGVGAKLPSKDEEE